ncbi:cytosolic phospholipase A2 epsilon-like isoform X2 [Varanus komodoensis]|uniref:cytosolic phospholipase A2 epsilon-like isoform X2 n=1 Tax=Varanus komodoensis TaxID=61221 RepID=UPI001CF7E1FF|nr:cytosolic phospholipase A2 epsilon-like isoform X2 [Varanus komodoensis]
MYFPCFHTQETIRGLDNYPDHRARRIEESPFQLLTVRILRARNIQKADILTESDCYVCLWLPTASSEKVRTITIPNSKHPVWNQAFCYRIDRRVKNILHLKLCDEDTFTKDDHLYTVLFDIAKLHPGQTSRVNFKLNGETQEELDVEFSLQYIPDCPENIVTNGTLVARDISCLEVTVDFEKLKQQYTSDLILTVRGSYEEVQKIPLDPDSTINNQIVTYFHCMKNHQSNLEVVLPKTQWSNLVPFRENSERDATVILPLTELPIEEEIILGENQALNLQVQESKWPKDLDVRIEYDLCAEEKSFLNKRRKYVHASVKKALQLQEVLQDDEVPVVAIMTTGGGTRSFTAMYGSLLGLQKLNLLDCITYITGLSGTTWTMGKLYEDAYWSQKYLEETISEARKQVVKSKFNCFSMDKLKYYYNELKQRTEEGHDTSFIDLWGLVIESMLHDEKNCHTLSEQQMAVSEGQNPLPIYLAVNLKNKYSAQDFREWLEFTPYEVGSFKYGAYIRSEDFGSEYFMGRLMKKLPESRMCFMEGMWSSIFSLDFMYVWSLASDSEDFWYKWTRDRVHDIDTVLDSLPDKLMETGAHPLSLVDTGFFINTSYPPLLIPQRKVDVILHLNYSGGGQTLNLDQFSAYASKQGIPFPHIELSEEDRENLKECYVFKDEDNAAVPIVLFFPLTNDTYKKYESPGVERSPANMAEGNVDVSSIFSPFTTREVSFSEKNFNRLVNLTEYNILNNEKKILDALRLAVERRKQQRQPQCCKFSAAFLNTSD